MEKSSTDLKEKTDKQNWSDCLEKYRVSKSIRKLKKHGHTLKHLGELLNIDRHLVYNLMNMNFKPPEGILEKLEKLHESI